MAKRQDNLDNQKSGSGKKNSRSKGNKVVRVLLIILSVLLSLILVASLAIVIGWNTIIGRFGGVGVSNDATISKEDAANIATEDAVTYDPNADNAEDGEGEGGGELYNPEDLTFEENVNHEGQGDHIVNILLVGQDARPGQGRQRSDSMMLVTFNKSKGTITLTSFMRDQYVQIPGYGATKLCHAYAYGGMKLLNQTLYNHYGIEIDGNLEVNFTGFEKIIDRLGGVEVELTGAEVKYLKNAGHKYVTKGKCNLKGETALLYARLRSIDNDYNRAERQRNVMSSLIEKYKDQGLTDMFSILYDVLPYVVTNMTEQELAGYLRDLFPMFSGAQVNTLRLPADDTFKPGFVKVSEGMKLWCQLKIDFEANRKLLEEVFEK